MNDPIDNKSNPSEREGTVKKLSLKREALKKLTVRSGVMTGLLADSLTASISASGSAIKNRHG